MYFGQPLFWQRHQRSLGFKFILHPFIPLQSIAKPVRRQQLSFKCPYDVMFILLASDFLGTIVWLSLLLFFPWSLHFSGGVVDVNYQNNKKTETSYNKSAQGHYATLLFWKCYLFFLFYKLLLFFSLLNLMKAKSFLSLI